MDGGNFAYCTKDNWILMYYPLKYVRKFVFVLVLAVFPSPITALSILIGLNIIFIVYMAVLRPRLFPYIIIDFVIEFLLLAFEIFVLVYVTINPFKVSVMSIVSHSLGFITANLSIIAALLSRRRPMQEPRLPDNRAAWRRRRATYR